jgi:hypothetical protein
MPGSLTTPGRSSTRITRPPMLPSAMTTASAPGTSFPFAARWLAYALPYRRFAAILADDDARLGADVDRYSFIATDLHRLSLPVSRRTVIEISGVALGTAIARRPPHRSRRALLTHRPPTSGHESNRPLG